MNQVNISLTLTFDHDVDLTEEELADALRVRIGSPSLDFTTEIISIEGV